MMDTPRGSLWEYVGPEPIFRNILHTVVFYEKGCIITWGQPLNFKRATTMRAGDTWMSDEDAFFKNFKPAVSGKPFSFT